MILSIEPRNATMPLVSIEDPPNQYVIKITKITQHDLTFLEYPNKLLSKELYRYKKKIYVLFQNNHSQKILVKEYSIDGKKFSPSTIFRFFTFFIEFIRFTQPNVN